MLGRNDAQLVAQLDERIRTVIMAPTSSSDRACMVAVLKLINAEVKPDKRQRLFDHFRRTAPRLDIVALETAYREVESELETKPISSGRARLADVKARLAQFAETVDGAPLQQSLE